MSTYSWSLPCPPNGPAGMDSSCGTTCTTTLPHRSLTHGCRSRRSPLRRRRSGLDRLSPRFPVAVPGRSLAKPSPLITSAAAASYSASVWASTTGVSSPPSRRSNGRGASGTARRRHRHHQAVVVGRADELLRSPSRNRQRPVRASARSTTGIPIWSAVIWPPARPGPLNRAARCDGVVPFTGDAMTPDQAADVHHAIRERREEPFDLCVWGLPARASEYRDAGVTWLLQAAMPDTPLGQVRDLIQEGPSTA